MTMDPGTQRLVREAEEAHQMLEQTLAKLAETQGKLQACEEIISRTRREVDDLFKESHFGHSTHQSLLRALGPVQ